MATTVEEQTVTGFANPMGTDGFEFVEYTAPGIELLRSLFTRMGFPEVARHKSKNVTLSQASEIATSSSTPSRVPTPRNMPRPTVPAPAQWRSGSRMRRPRTSAR